MLEYKPSILLAGPFPFHIFIIFLIWTLVVKLHDNDVQCMCMGMRLTACSFFPLIVLLNMAKANFCDNFQSSVTSVKRCVINLLQWPPIT